MEDDETKRRVFGITLGMLRGMSKCQVAKKEQRAKRSLYSTAALLLTLFTHGPFIF